MCESQLTDERRSSRKNRIKIWELDPRFHCPIVGTCLTLVELRRLYCKTEGPEAERCASDYEIHVSFVGAASQSQASTKLVQKFLDKKFKTIIKWFSKAKRSEELALMWNESIEKGDVAGPFWALVTHPAAAEDLLLGVYSEVHMLSHLTGASTRADLRRLNMLERRCAQLERALDRAKARAARHLQKHQKFVQAVSGRLAQTVETERCLEETQISLQRWENGMQASTLNNKNRLLAKELIREKVRTEQAQKEAQKRSRMADRMKERLTHLQAEVDEYRRIQAPYNTESTAANQVVRNIKSAQQDPKLNLNGRRILYVGGLSNLAPHLRALVERHGGQFLHYDGMHNGHTQLGGLLDQADAVLCPLNCISHEACGRIKQFCKQHAKPLVMLRNASLSSFSSGLRGLAS